MQQDREKLEISVGGIAQGIRLPTLVQSIQITTPFCRASTLPLTKTLWRAAAAERNAALSSVGAHIDHQVKST
ncbi:hypothetical protein OUZ56_001301 [Daphnia magna]|uniref:Uncharacterized protein n=1 Tax=Daphnia magna TaxID=35525 RepID=A0ABR0A2A7_9CRUS|nr:hypothetical protein OUZ56_001301 [Daphnia magna]